MPLTKTRATKAKKTVIDLPRRWWRAEDADLADQLVAHAHGVATSQDGRVSNYKKALKLYQGADVLPGRSVAYLSSPDGQLISLNVVASIIRTLRAKIVKNRPAPMVLTDGGSQRQQDQAKAMQAFLEGALYESGAYEAMEKAFDLAAICGDGWIKVFPDFEDETIRVEPRYPWQAFVCDQEGYSGKPRSIYERAYLDRELLLAVYGEDEKVRDAILRASQSKGDPDFGFGSTETDQVEVWEGWRIPSTRKSEDGRHAIALPEATLLAEPWDRERYPWAHFAIEREPIGCHGTGICSELYGMQLEINELVLKIQEGHQTGGQVMILVEEGSSVNPAKLTNQLHAIVYYKGTPPTPTTIPAVSGETYSHLWNLVDRMYAMSGISQLAAQAVKPAGLNSGRALRTHHDLETERFSYISRAYERLVIEVSQLILDAAQDLAEQVPSFSVRCAQSKSIRRIKWKDVDLDRDSFVMKVHPTSFLPQTPAGRMSAVADLLELRVIDPREGARLLDFPDAASRPDPYQASVQLAQTQIDRILQDGEAQTPETYQDLATSLQVALSAYCQARSYSDVEPERLDLLREYIDDLQAKLAPPEPPAPPMPPEMPMPASGEVPPVDPTVPAPAPVPGAM